MRHASFTHATLIHICDNWKFFVFESCLDCQNVWHDSFVCVTWLVHTCHKTYLHVSHDSFIHATWLIAKKNHTAHSYISHCTVCLHDSFIYVTVYTQESQLLIYVTWRIHVCDMSNSYMSRLKISLLARPPWLCAHASLFFKCGAHDCVMAHIWMCHVTGMNQSCHKYERVTCPTVMSHV